MGVHPLIGHWRECQDRDVEYKDCPEDKLVDVIERSYFVQRPDDVSPDEFADLIFELANKYDQDGVVLRVDALDLNGVYGSKNREEFVKFENGIKVNKIAQAYSQHVKKQNTPFVFEGVETPNATVTVRKAIYDKGFRW